MEIQFVSTLAAEDEQKLAPKMLSALEGLLRQMPISYNLRAMTDSGHLVQRTRAPRRRLAVDDN